MNIQKSGITKKIDKFYHYPFGYVLRSAFSNKYSSINKFYLNNNKYKNKKIKVLVIGTYKMNNLLPFNQRGFSLYGRFINIEDKKFITAYSKKIELFFLICLLKNILFIQSIKR